MLIENEQKQLWEKNVSLKSRSIQVSVSLASF